LALAFCLFCPFIIKASKKSLQIDEMPMSFCHRIVVGGVFIVVDYFWGFGILALAFCLFCSKESRLPLKDCFSRNAIAILP